MSDTNGNVTNGNGRTATPRETAAAAYAEHLRNVGAMLDWLESELEAHAEKQKSDPVIGASSATSWNSSRWSSARSATSAA